MLVSHEVPLCLLEHNKKRWSHFQYCLPHLLDKYPVYKEFFLRYREEKGSFIMMDNGLFEGVTHTEQDLIEKINLIKPDIFIVPDKWNDADEGHKNAKYWMNILKPQLPEETNLMVVLQGKDFFQLRLLYLMCLDLGYTHFAFNHSSIAYQNENYNPNPLLNQAFGRNQIISKLRKEGIIKDHHYIHLLGASHPIEFQLYKDPYYSFINSIDTSLPIINGIKGINLDLNNRYEKPKEKIEDFMEMEYPDLEIRQEIDYNANFIKLILKTRTL